MKLKTTVFTPDSLKSEAHYTIEVSKRSTLGGTASENRITYRVKKEIIKAEKDGNVIYAVETLHHEHTNASPIHELEADMAFLSGKVALRVTPQGIPIKVLNMYEIEEKWQDNRKVFYQKHKAFDSINLLLEQTDHFVKNHDLFLSSFIESEIGTVLFPAIYGATVKEVTDRKTEKVFTGFIGEKGDLPLTLTNSAYQFDKLKRKGTLFRKGQLNIDAYHEDKVSLFFQKLMEGKKVKTQPVINYIETYDLDNYNWITHAGQVLSASIPLLFSYQQIVRVQPSERSVL